VSVGSATGGAGAGKVAFTDFTIKKQFDASSASLLKAAFAGTNLKAAVLTVENSSGVVQETIKLENVFIANVTTNTDLSVPGSSPETVSLKFGTIEVTVTPAEGTTKGDTETATWDLTTNKI
jgi:type VI protein secretion system component Hcp